MRGGQTAGGGDLVGQRFQCVVGVAQVTDSVIETDPGETGDDFLLPVLRRHDDQLVGRVEDGARLFGETPVRGYVHRAAQVSGGELLRVAGVHDDSSRVTQLGELGRRQRPRGRRGVVPGAVLAVQFGVVGEVAGRRGLAGGDERDELLASHRSAGVVGGALLADGRLLLGREVLAAGGAGTVRGEDPHLVGKAHQLVLDAVVEHRAELLGGDADGREQVGASDIADEQRVAGEDAVRDGVVGVLVHEDADGLGGVPGRLHDLQGDVTEGDPLALGERADRVLGLGPSAVSDPGAGLVRHLQVAGDEVRMEVRVDHADHREAVRGGVGQVLGDVPARVDDHRLARALVGNHVRRLGEAVEVVLVEEHGNPFIEECAPRGGCEGVGPLGCCTPGVTGPVLGQGVQAACTSEPRTSGRPVRTQPACRPRRRRRPDLFHASGYIPSRYPLGYLRT